MNIDYPMGIMFQRKSKPIYTKIYIPRLLELLILPGAAWSGLCLTSLVSVGAGFVFSFLMLSLQKSYELHLLYYEVTLHYRFMFIKMGNLR